MKKFFAIAIALTITALLITPQEYIKSLYMDYEVQTEVIELDWGNRCEQKTAIFADGTNYKIGGCEILERPTFTYG